MQIQAWNSRCLGLCFDLDNITAAPIFQLLKIGLVSKKQTQVRGQTQVILRTPLLASRMASAAGKVDECPLGKQNTMIQTECSNPFWNSEAEAYQKIPETFQNTREYSVTLSKYPQVTWSFGDFLIANINKSHCLLIEFREMKCLFYFQKTSLGLMKCNFLS